MNTEIIEHKGIIIQRAYTVTFPDRGQIEMVFNTIEEAKEEIDDYLEEECGEWSD